MPTLFEIHITTTELDEALIQEFVGFCAAIDAKPILIELPVGQQRQQPMISKVVKLEDPQDIHLIIVELEASFVAAGFPATRTKVEVPLEYETDGKAAFPDFRGGYYEWHGRVKTVDPGALADICAGNGFHLSRNSLKGKTGTRLVTVRDFTTAHRFKRRIEAIKSLLERNGFMVEKDEAEYCVFDSNKAIDRGWSDVPEFTDYTYATQLAIDGFMRRVAVVGGPFMAKGSVIMRQYLPDPMQRPAEDIDFVYLGEADEATAAGIFTDWLTQVTEAEVNDDVTFRSFTENAFWRGIDYAMNDDFPTTNTDLLVTVHGREPEEIGLDISWNLPLPDAPVVMHYRPLVGESFELEHTVPLSLQISWKLHQTVVRPRYKDITDLLVLLAHPLVDREVLEKSTRAYQMECEKDYISPNRLGFFIAGRSAYWTLSMPTRPIHYFRSFQPDPTEALRYSLPQGFDLSEPIELDEGTVLKAIDQLAESLQKAGLTELMDLTPRITWQMANQVVKKQEQQVTAIVEPKPSPKARIRWWQRLFN